MTELAVEQPNLSKLLHEARYVREDTYNFFIQMATKCHLLIETYMVGRYIGILLDVLKILSFSEDIIRKGFAIK